MRKRHLLVFSFLSVPAALAACSQRIDLGGVPPTVSPADAGIDVRVDAGADAFMWPTSPPAPPAPPLPCDAGGSCPPNQECVGSTAAERWPTMLSAPFSPTTLYAGLDLGYGDKWPGLTVEEAELGNCTATLPSPGYGYWGANKEVQFRYDLDTRIIYEVMLGVGYTGTWTLQGYVVGIGTAILANGMPVALDWTNQAALDQTFTAMFNAWPTPTGTTSANCRLDGQCVIVPDDGTGVGTFGIPVQGIYLRFHTQGAQPEASSPFEVDGYIRRVDATASFDMTLKIDGSGPTIQGQSIGDESPPPTCAPALGMTGGTWIDDCVNVWKDPNTDTATLNGALGGMGITLDHFQLFDDGWGPEFTPGDPTAINATTSTPQRNAAVTGFVLNHHAPHTSANERSASGATDLHGTGLVLREWARLVQNDFSSRLPASAQHALGDPACLGGSPAAGCTGFEAITLPGPTYADDSPEVTALVDPRGAGYVSVLVPAYPGLVSTFCNDPGTFAACTTGPLFENALARVTQVLGGGSSAALPADAQDLRYFFRFFGIAIMKYLKAYGASAQTTPSAVAATTIDMEALTFGRDDANVYDQAFYAERGFLPTSGGAPLDTRYTTYLGDSSVQYLGWFQRVEREATAVYASLGAPSSSANVAMLTNLAGSPLLSRAYASLYCATTIDRTGCPTSAPPPQSSPGVLAMDLNGTSPLLSHYPGAFGTTYFQLGHSGTRVLGTYASEAVYASLEVRNLPNPYAPFGPGNNGTPIDFPAALTLVAKVTLPTGPSTAANLWVSQLALPGDFGQITLDYGDYVDPTTGQPNGEIVIYALEARNFLGEVFLCSDPVTGDLLHARAYTAASDLTSWIRRSSERDLRVRPPRQSRGHRVDRERRRAHPLARRRHRGSGARGDPLRPRLAAMRRR